MPGGVEHRLRVNYRKTMDDLSEDDIDKAIQIEDYVQYLVSRVILLKARARQ